MSVFRIAIRIVWSFGSGSIGFRIFGRRWFFRIWIWFRFSSVFGSCLVFRDLDLVFRNFGSFGFFGSGSGFWFSSVFGSCLVFRDLDSFCLLIQRCKIRGDIKTFFDQYSVLPDERKICPMNVKGPMDHRIFSRAASSSLCPFPTGMAFPCTYIVLPRISSILLILII